MKNGKRRKYRRQHTYEGHVRNMRMTAAGRTKREATKKLRKAFADAGHPTNPNGLDDLMTVRIIPQS